VGRSTFLSSALRQPNARVKPNSTTQSRRMISLTGQVADSTRFDEHVVLDANTTKRAQLVDELPLHHATALVIAQRREQRVDHIQPGLDGEHLAGLDRGRVAQELVIGARWAQLHADIVRDHAERVAEPVRKKYAGDATLDDLGTLRDAEIAQHVGEQA